MTTLKETLVSYIRKQDQKSNTKDSWTTTQNVSQFHRGSYIKLRIEWERKEDGTYEQSPMKMGALNFSSSDHPLPIGTLPH
jgi:hypothetical protein